MRRTKIICTLGPAVDDESVIRKLLLKGADAVRLNMSHGTHETHGAILNKVKKVRGALGLPVASILDTKGPEIRIGTFGAGKAELVSGESFTITTRKITGNGSIVSVSYDNLHNELSPGDRILIDDGLVELKVTGISGTEINCQVLNGGEISDHKSVNIPDVRIKFPVLSEQDEKDIGFAAENGMDYIAVSFVRSREDVLAVRETLKKYNADNIKIISKIENREGVRNIDEITAASDAVMVARGDLGVEIPAWDVPVIQKKIISKGALLGKPVIIATQMLDSMIRNPRPTRAEVSDVSNAVFDGASCVMLSGETAAGRYPVESVATMVKTIEAAEAAINYWKRFLEKKVGMEITISNAISHSCCTTAMDLGADAIITVTKSGHTARMISRFRPQCPIVAITDSETVQRQLSISWGVRPELSKPLNSTDELFEDGIRVALLTGTVKKGDTVVLTAGVPVGISGTTNLIKAQTV